MTTLTNHDKEVLSDEFVTALLQEIDILDTLKTKSNSELADLVLDHIWADTVIGSPQSALLNEVMDRLRGNILEAS